MPTISNADLRLIQEGNKVLVVVTYRATFSTLERRLVGLGLRFVERVRIIGLDPSHGTVGPTLRTLMPGNIEVPDGNGPWVYEGNREWNATREQLNEDPGLGDNDEIRGVIRIDAIGLPTPMTEDFFTDRETLAG